MKFNFYNEKYAEITSGRLVLVLLGLLVLVVSFSIYFQTTDKSDFLRNEVAKEQQCRSFGYENYDQQVYCDNNRISDDVSENLRYLLCDIESEEYALYEEVKEYTENEEECNELEDEECTCVMNAFFYQRNRSMELLDGNLDGSGVTGIGGIIGDKDTGQEEGLMEFFFGSREEQKEIDSSPSQFFTADPSEYVNRAKQELSIWEENNWTETSADAESSLEKYWSFTNFGDWTASGTAWSAAFISYIVNGDFSSSAHWRYILQAKENKIDRWRFIDPNEQSTQIKQGDIICYSRDESVTYEMVKSNNYENTYESHCDITSSVSDSSAIVIGGNVDDKVASKQLSLNSGELDLSQREYVAILRLKKSPFQNNFEGDVNEILANFAQENSIEVEKLKAFLIVESGSRSFYDNGHPVVRFECSRYNERVQESQKVPCDTSSYKYGSAEDTGYNAFRRALEKNRETTLMQTSFGLGQVMGFNYESAGFSSAEELYEASKVEEGQITMFLNFLKNSNPTLIDELQNENTNWATIARLYNGEDFVTNQYHIKMQREYDRLKRTS